MYIFAEKSAIIDDFGCMSIEGALQYWALWFLGNNGYPTILKENDVPDPNQRFYADEEHLIHYFTALDIQQGGERLKVGNFKVDDNKVIRLKAEPVVKLPTAVAGSSTEVLNDARQAMLEEFFPGEDLLESDDDAASNAGTFIDHEYDDERTERDRFNAAELNQHKDCVTFKAMCSTGLCPRFDELCEKPSAVEEDQEGTAGPEEKFPGTKEEWFSTPDIPDYVEEDGIVFGRVIGDGVTCLDPAGADFLAPKRNAFFSIIRFGRVYVSSSCSVKLPTKTKKYRQQSENVPDNVRETWLKEHSRVDHSEVRTSVPTYFLEQEGTVAQPPVPKGKQVAASKKPEPMMKTVTSSPIVIEDSDDEEVIVKSPQLQVAKKQKVKKAKAPKPTGNKTEPTSIQEAFYKQFSKTTGKSSQDKDATIDGLSKSEWLSKYCVDAVVKSGETQQAGCVCTTYPCRHTKNNISSKIISNRDKTWNDVFNKVSGKKDVSKKDEPSPKKEGGTSKEPLEKVNPLRAKNVPRSSGLTVEQRNSLKKYFGLPEEIPSDDFNKLSQEEKNEIRRAGKIPHWAIALVMRHDKNLSRIISGSIDKEKAVEELKEPLPKPRSAADQWKRLKDRFEGVQLLEKPRTGKQKALKGAFDKLAKEFPDNPALPKPRKVEGKEQEDDSKSKTKASPKPSAGGGDTISLDTIKAIASLAKLFR
jgi:hypothetical protein